jgi:AraC-like DNA-binding protein
MAPRSRPALAGSSGAAATPSRTRRATAQSVRAPSCTALEISHYARCAGIPDPAAAFGIPQATLDDPEAVVPVTVLYDALERAAAHCGDPHFGLRFAIYWLKVAEGGIGALQFLLTSSPNLRTACDRIAHYQQYWCPAEWYEIADRDGAYCVRYRCWGPPREAHVHQAEKMAVMTALVPRAVDPTCRPISVAFEHARRDDDERLASVLGVQPTYGAPWTEVAIPVEVMDRPWPRANPALFRYIDRTLEQRLAAMAPAARSMEGMVYAAVKRLLHERGFGPARVASSVGCSTRTMARRLAEEGTSLRRIVDTVRQERAQGYLEAGLTLKEVAFLLGYSDATAFQHAFRRWYGKSPKAWLEEHAGADADALKAAVARGTR